MPMPKSWTRNTIIALPVGLAAAAVLAGCGSGDGGAPASSSAASGAGSKAAGATAQASSAASNPATTAPATGQPASVASQPAATTPPGATTPPAAASGAAASGTSQVTPTATVTGALPAAPVPGTATQGVDPAAVTTPVPGQGTAPVSDPCALVTAEQVKAVMGDVGAPTSQFAGSPEFSYSSCQWSGSGGLASALWVLVTIPGTVKDPAGLLLPPDGPASAAAPTPPGGVIYPGGFLGGQWLPGQTSAWSVNGKQALLVYNGADVDAARGQTLIDMSKTMNERLQ